MSISKNNSYGCITTHYEILGLSDSIQRNPSIPVRTLRRAYHRTLLENHPDKAKSNVQRLNNKGYSIDQITRAFSTLLNPTLRAKYDNELKIQQTMSLKGSNAVDLPSSAETIDLDDMEFDGSSRWYKSCRCGNEEGFLVLENDLEDAAEEGEVNVECRGCSLTLKVVFCVCEEEAEAEEQEK